jgi:hypothetical protein
MDFRFKEAYSWLAIAAHAKFEQHDWLRILILSKIEMILSRGYFSNC